MENDPQHLSAILDRIAFSPEPLSIETRREFLSELGDARADLVVPPELGTLLFDLVGIPKGARVFDPGLGAGTLYLDVRDRAQLFGIPMDDPTGSRLARLLLPKVTLIDSPLTECAGDACFDYIAGVMTTGEDLVDRRRDFDHARASGVIRSEAAWFELAVRLVRQGGAIALVVTTDALRQMMTPTMRWWLASRVREVAKVYLPKSGLGAEGPVCLVIFEKRPAIPSVTSFRFVMTDWTSHRGALKAWSEHLKRNHDIRLRDYALSLGARTTRITDEAHVTP